MEAPTTLAFCATKLPPRFSSGVTVVQDFPSSSCFGGGPSNFTLDFWFPLSLLLLPLCIPGFFLHVFTRLVLQSSSPPPWGASRSCSHYPGLFTILLLPVVFPISLCAWGDRANARLHNLCKILFPPPLSGVELLRGDVGIWNFFLLLGPGVLFPGSPWASKILTSSSLQL